MIVMLAATLCVSAQTWVNIKDRDGRYVSMEVTPELELSLLNMEDADSTMAHIYGKKMPNAMRLSLKSGENREIVFTRKPKISHTADGTVILSDESEKYEYAVKEIDKLCFFVNDGVSAITNVYGDKQGKAGIYKLNGMKVKKISKPGYYVVNGVKVLIK